MKTFIVCAHAEPKSFNGALRQATPDTTRAGA
jgi:putative NADPH-quinone reductase